VRLLDGRILVAGGSNSSGTALASAEMYDPGTGHWTLTGSMGQARYGATLTRLNNGWVLATGGFNNSGSPALASAELFDPSMGIWTPTGSMQNGRRYQSATLLSDGTVLVAGGKGTGTDPYINTAEVYMPPLAYPATTFHPVPQTRIMDTRTGLGLTGRFGNRSPRALTVIGAGGVPPSAIAVTGIVTVTQQTVPGYISVGPSVTGTPSSSTLNFPLGDTRANNVTAALDQQGKLSFVFCAPSITGTGSGDILFDVTGYFTSDDSGATFKPLTPARVMDSRDGNGLPAAGAYVSKSPKTTTIWGAGGVPAGAVAVTGNLTVAYPSSAGWAYVGTSIPADPATLNASVVNAQAGEIKADGITVGLTGDGKLSFVWVGGTGSTASVIFDVTGYFVQGLGGARFVPLDPIRVADTRIGLPVQGPMKAFTPIKVPVGGKSHLPQALVGVSGNLTVVGQSVAGYLTVAPIGYTSTTPTSTLNFPLGDIRANGFYVSTAADASIGVTFLPTRNTSTHFVMDVTGYFLPVMP
jgi:Kelch motif